MVRRAMRISWKFSKIHPTLNMRICLIGCRGTLTRRNSISNRSTGDSQGLGGERIHCEQADLGERLRLLRSIRKWVRNLPCLVKSRARSRQSSKTSTRESSMPRDSITSPASVVAFSTWIGRTTVVQDPSVGWRTRGSMDNWKFSIYKFSSGSYDSEELFLPVRVLLTAPWKGL